MNQHQSLDFQEQEFANILQKTIDLVLEQYAKVDQQAGFHAISQKDVAAWFDEPLPLLGHDPITLLEQVKQQVLDSATGNLGPNMYAYVMAGGNQISTIADFLTSTINQNATKWHLGPAMTEIEKRVIQWTAEMLGYTPDAGGVMVSGGSAATLTGLTVGRNVFLRQHNVNKHGLFGLRPLTIYCSTETHSSTDKSVALLGIGTQYLRKIPTDDQFKIDLGALQRQIEQDIKDGLEPFCIVGNAGTVNTGAIDDLTQLASIAKRHGMWFHVDGAYGGLVSSLPSLQEQYKGMELADSIALDFHKWLYQPFEIGCTLVRNWDLLRESYFKQADYLDTSLEAKSDRLEFNEHYFQLSRNAKAFKVWLSLKAYGFQKIQAMMQKDLDLTRYLEQQILDSPDFELKSRSDLAIACFRYIGQGLDENQIKQVNQDLIAALEKDGRIFITGTRLRGEFVLRACIINHRKTRASIDYLLEVIRDVAQHLRASASQHAD
ncbi:pyridoxal phosphate-dependent decarboxylase family protein [Undibacterium fentianense]|uniref:Aminotransferase class I/II-fold pyridoxal phosphate-dependent enzyme n=1 Tax=Undibacterium fentianense TaxID=2828728 RepID=A0A941E096_9BURK|nr:aminotransferase class I/II-fold pyridoxal phosphate-dependent enzyme [Undibacterium fentianense]MBR7800050.1 aminotransferase class I/II-fold pyridoxal phosphate-dependent enzyme [Undibacterium fentianense]